MRFDERLLDEIKSRLRLSDVIGRTVKLRRQGREYVGLSPFTKEKTPSFFVNDDKGHFFDFSSGKTGDLISFLQETERLSFPEAVERLAAEAGVALPALDPRGAEEDKKRQGLQDWLVAAAAWFEAELRRPGGRDARAYLERRGLKEEDCKRFGLGYAPADRTKLKDYLIAKGALPAELVDSGLLIAPEDGGAPYDRFRERIIFPITDGRGRVVSFGGRALDPNARAKYLNGPETPLFHKSRVLYGLAEARKLQQAAGEGAPVVVVEGYMDVIACQRAGIAGVAAMGTALTEEQMEALWKLHPEPTLCFDADTAGRRAASRAIDRALPLLRPGKSFRFALLSGGKDADDVLREQGAAALKAQLSQAHPFVEALFVRERDLEALDTPERRTALKGRLRQAAQQIGDRELAGAYREELAVRFDAAFPRAQGAPAFRAAFQPGPRSGRRGIRPGSESWPIPSTPEARAAAKRLSHSPELLSAALAKAVLDDPARLDACLESFEAAGFGDPALEPLAQEITRLRLEADVLDRGALARHLAQKGFGVLLGEIDEAAARSGAPFLDADRPLADARTLWSHAFESLTRMAALEDALASAKADLGDAGGAATLVRLKSERDALKRAIRTGSIWSDGAEHG
ncbi:MAG TPA: DNA primase [Caulobacteraceae bacterium]